MDKLNALAARAMGWYESIETLEDILIHWYGNDALVFTRRVSDWNPAECADDALVLLEKVAGHKIISIHRTGDDEFGPWECAIEVFDEREFLGTKAESHAFGATLHLAATLCALRAAGIPEDQIAKAMED